MYMLISPAKKLDESPQVNPTAIPITEPELLGRADELARIMQRKAPDEIAALMKLSDKLAELNFERYQAWEVPFPEERTKPAVFLFRGDVYQGLDADTLKPSGLQYAQKHLGILSGLYGLLRPLDRILPYRLEMGTRLENPAGKDLYAFWGEAVTGLVNERLAASGSRQLVNLASNEYWKAVDANRIEGEVITPVFKDWKNGQYKIISFHAKKARGMMVRWAIDHQVQDAEELKYFDYGGYGFAPELSDEKNWVFTRRQEA